MGDNLNQILQNHQNQLDSSHDMVQDMNHMKHKMHDNSAHAHEEHDMMMMMYFYFGYENVQMIIKDWLNKIFMKNYSGFLICTLLTHSSYFYPILELDYW